ncbi:hypothetical protein H7097_01865 [Aeromicrobium sp.]|nr:hypothetical protein [Candidatus Saccharibacteria bacterium]
MANKTHNFDSCVLRKREVKLDPKYVERAAIVVTCPAIGDSGGDIERFNGEGFDLYFDSLTERSTIWDANRRMKTVMGLGKCVSRIYANNGIQDELGITVLRTNLFERQLFIETEEARQRALQEQINELHDPYQDRD